MEAQKISSGLDLLDWLKGKPLEWTYSIVSRAPLRALEFLSIEIKNHETLSDRILFCFRANILSWISSAAPEIITSIAISSAYHVSQQLTDSNSFADKVSWSVTMSSAKAMAIWAIESSSERSSMFARECVTGAVDFAAMATMDRGGEPVEDAMWKALQRDCQWLESQFANSGSWSNLSTEALWPSDQMNIRFGFKQHFYRTLESFDPNYSVWIDWYERRIRGERASFDIPGDKGNIEDKKILRRLAEASDEDFWGKGHEYVNATLKSWLEEARARVASSELDPIPAIPDVPNGQSFESVAETLLQQASPEAQITDGKLDAAPNTTFDKPQYSDNLAELPSELLAYTSTILNSLPPNCAAIVRNCFTGFRDELLVRGNRPILNILKAMAASLTAELYGNLPNDAPPDEWRLKDPREWGDGFQSMFGHFFKGYHDLIHHFPLDAEREDFIGATPIDEMAASGAALTEPVDAVAALVFELGKQGFATDNIVRIIEAHQIYNRDIAQLPPPTADSNAVSPKRRHVLATAGFYLNTYSVLGTTASLYALQTVPAVQALIPQLKAAADALLAFVL